MPGASRPRTMNANASIAGDAPLPSGGLRASERADRRIRHPFAIHALAIAASLTLMPFAHAGPLLLDFSRSEVIQTFRVINDDVMGGVSTSRSHATNGALVFEGVVSLEKNGGFASLRGPIIFPVESAALLLKVRGDGKRYKVTLKLDDSPGTGQYQADFVAPREWQTLRFMPADFTYSFRGRATAAPIVRFVDVGYFGLLIADRQPGAFKVEMASVLAE
jgi:NADH dehydrogenase [ubiquinone] 1 alpha subcomplex assembly factor 1